MHARLYLPAKANRRTCARKRGTGPAQRAAAFVAELQPGTWQGPSGRLRLTFSRSASSRRSASTDCSTASRKYLWQRSAALLGPPNARVHGLRAQAYTRTHKHTHAHTRTHARTHAHTHTRHARMHRHHMIRSVAQQRTRERRFCSLALHDRLQVWRGVILSCWTRQRLPLPQSTSHVI
jgi:hypothetical protein